MLRLINSSASALAAFVAERAIGRGEAALCALCWLESTRATDGATDGVSGREIVALYPMHGGRRMSGVSALLASLARGGLAESAGAGRYRTTPLGRAVVDALPDAAEVARLRGTRIRRAYHYVPARG